jgi:hypothetical protein
MTLRRYSLTDFNFPRQCGVVVILRES